MPPAESRGLRIHRPCRCLREQGASQSAHSDDHKDDHDEVVCFENESLIVRKTRNQQTNLIPCVVVIIACPRCSHLRFCNLKRGSNGSSGPELLAS